MSTEAKHLREFGKFRLDVEKKVLWHDGEPVDLPLKEVELLCVLTENVGEVVTKKEILNKIWPNSFVEESNLSRHIYLLRKTFKDFGEEEDLIQNIPRRGYRFAGEVRQGEVIIEKHSFSQTFIEEIPANFSAQSQALIGRTDEVNVLKKLLRLERTRLLTLTGAGGTGKTRLAQHLARDLVGEFPEGVFFVNLAPIMSHNMVAATIAEVLGVQQTSERSFAEGLRGYLRDQRVLLVLDNFEHVTEAASLVAGLVSECPPLKVLVTSRALLHVVGEQEFRVPPLALLLPDDLRSAADLGRYGAPALFVERMGAVKPTPGLSDEEARKVAEICVRLDGLPLALELAAARTRMLSPEELLQRLDHRLNLLKGGARDLPARQQTMRSTIAWSYDLLGNDEKTLFCRLSIFSGGFTIAAAEIVCGEVGGVSIDVLDALESLVDESLVLKKEADGWAYRFLTLETIREFGLEQLEASGEIEELRRKHANYFLSLAEKAEPHMMTAGREPWVERLEAEHNNLRAALQWAADGGEAITGLRLTGALRWFWYQRGHFGEGYQWAQKFLTMPGGAAPTAVRAKALFCCGNLAFYYGEPATACTMLEESVGLLRELGDRRLLAYALFFTGMAVILSRRDYESGRAAAEESVALFRELDDVWGLALSLVYAGVILWYVADDENRAVAVFEESRRLFKELGDGWGVSGPLIYLGAIRQEHGDNAAARSFYEEAIALHRESKDTWRLASTLDLLAELLRAEGEPARADELVEESLTLQRKIGRSLCVREMWQRMKKDGWLGRRGVGSH